MNDTFFCLQYLEVIQQDMHVMSAKNFKHAYKITCAFPPGAKTVPRKLVHQGSSTGSLNSL